MQLRRDPTYLSSDTWRALRLLSKVRGKRTDAQGFETVSTPDELADELLRELIKEKHPGIFEHFKAVKKMEDALLKTMGGTKDGTG